MVTQKATRHSVLPILYSFRRCPYAMRARLAIAIAQQAVELREVVLKNKPPELIKASSKATVPVLVDDQCVIDESLQIMQWALARNDPEQWLSAVDGDVTEHHLVKEHDESFKPILDKYKYFDRYPEFSQDEYFVQALPFLKKLDACLQQHQGYLAAAQFSALDAAIFPFIRQFAHCDKAKFDEVSLPALKTWLEGCLQKPIFTAIMKKYPAWSAELNNHVNFSI